MMMRRDSLTAVTGVGVLATLAGIVSPSLADAATHRAVVPASHPSHAKPTFHPRNAPPSIMVTSKADNNSPGTLRAALQSADAGDVIGFASSVTGTITLTSSLYLYQPVYIEGPGSGSLDINGAGKSTVFTDDASGRSTITGLTISDGKATYGTGGGIAMYRGSLTLYKDVITGNTASDNGGGISLGNRVNALDIYDSTISGNTATKAGGGIFAGLAGGSIAGAEMTIERSTISGNTAGTRGGGIYADSCPGDGYQQNVGTDPPSCSFPERTHLDSKTPYCYYSAAATLTGDTCYYQVSYTSVGNTAYCDYGSLSGTASNYKCSSPAGYHYTYSYYCPTGTTLTHSTCYGVPTGYSSGETIDTSTISGNTAASGGGLFFRSMAGQAEVLRSTIAGNTGGGIDDDAPSGQPQLVADLISNTGADCTAPASPALKDQGYNLVTDGSCELSAASSHASTALSGDLAPLGSNGGPTQTIALARTSSDPAFQTVPASATLPGSSTPICSGTDQRGVARSGSCDIGAFNSEPAPTVSTSLSSGTAKTKYGWYRSNVTVSFPCTTGAPGIVSVTCPAPKVDSKQGKNVAVSGTAIAQDGATATATAHVNLDKTKPSVKGVKSGSTYKKTPKIKCSDSLSGVASCKVTKTKPSSKHVVKYRVTATDKAGNVKTVKGSYKLKK